MENNNDLKTYVTTAIILACCVIKMCHSRETISSQQCPVVTPTSVKIVRGWPAQISCTSLEKEVITLTFNQGYPLQSVLELSCVIYGTDPSSPLHQYNYTFDLDFEETRGVVPLNVDQVERNQTFTIHLTSGAICRRSEFVVVSVDPSTRFEYNETCSDSFHEAFVGGHIFRPTIHCDRTHKLHCQVNSHEDPLYNYTSVTWFRNCQEMTSDQYVSFPSAGNGIPSIRIKNSDDLVANYSCMVTYNGQTRFIRHQSVCVIHPSSVQRQNLISAFTKVVYVTPGDDVTLTCSGSGGLGSDGNRKEFFWNTTRHNLCRNRQILGGSNSTNGQKYSCSELSTATKLNKVCSYTPTCGDFQNLTEKFRIGFTIRNVTSSDFMTYYCRVNTTSSDVWDQITLLPTPPRPPVEEVTLALAIATGFVFLILVLFVFCWVFQLDILLLKKKYLAKYSSAEKKYAAFLTYSFNRDEDGDDTNEFLNCLHNWFDVNNYFVYDEHRHGAGDLHVESVMRAMEESHRTVAVVTPSYLRSENKIQDIQSGIWSKIKNRTKMIFLITPSADKILKKMRRANSESLRTIMSAIKQKPNNAIRWSGIKQKSKFFKQLDVAMPKLRPDGYVIENSSLSSDETFDKKRPSYKEGVKSISSTIIV